MSFWQTSKGEEVTGEVVENSGFAPLPKDWYPSMIEEMVIDEYEGDRKVKIKARIVGEKYKNRVAFLNLKVFDDDEKKRDRALQVLVKMAKLLSIPLPKGEPNDAWLSKFLDKPIELLLDAWETTTASGKEISGNWLVNVQAVGAKVEKTASLPTKSRPSPSRPSESREPGMDDDIDHDIPF